MIELHKKDAFAFLETLPTESVDMVFTDPPYWTLNKWRNVGTTTRLGGNADKDKQSGWFKTINSEELWQLMCELNRVLKKDRHAFIMCDGQTLKYVLSYAEESGFNYFKPLVWDKVSLGMGYHFRNRHEFIVMLDKGKNRKPKNLSLPDIFTVPMIKGGYPTEKPINLINTFVEQFTEENELVIDPFFGGGSVPNSCQTLKRLFKGSDISEDAHKYANDRLFKISNQLNQLNIF
jgi:site-specific DNA-methyltransferase (adenine-specific)